MTVNVTIDWPYKRDWQQWLDFDENVMLTAGIIFFLEPALDKLATQYPQVTKWHVYNRSGNCELMCSFANSRELTFFLPNKYDGYLPITLYLSKRTIADIEKDIQAYLKGCSNE